MQNIRVSGIGGSFPSRELVHRVCTGHCAEEVMVNKRLDIEGDGTEKAGKINLSY
jgi:hypothetical protein